MGKKKPSIYLLSICLFMLVLPVLSIVLESNKTHSLSAWALIGKWFVFWAVGARLFLAGLRQATKPGFTAKEIFHFSGEESYVVIRELGFANISIGLAGMLSIFKIEWTQIIAIVGGLFFGLAGFLHLVKKPVSRNEIIAMISDLFIFFVLAIYSFHTS